MCGCSPTGPSSSTPPARGSLTRRAGHPVDGYPTGAQWISRYLAPLADALGDRVRYGARVIGVSRSGRDRLVDAGRGDQPFTVHVRPTGATTTASGTPSSTPRARGSTPTPRVRTACRALGERAAADRLIPHSRLPDRSGSRADTPSSSVPDTPPSPRCSPWHGWRAATRHDGDLGAASCERGKAFGGSDADEAPARGPSASGLRFVSLVTY
jgi:hypothetical protein